jgi:hypothetical protein
MSKKAKDTLITKEKAQEFVDSRQPPHELLLLIELVNEIPKRHPGLPKYEAIREGITSKQSWRQFQPFGHIREPEPDLPVYLKDGYALQNKSTAQTAIEEIKRITKDLPKLYNYLFGINQEPYLQINKRYEMRNDYGLLEKYDEILSFTHHLVDMAIHCSIFCNDFGVKGFEELALKETLEIDIYPSNFYVRNGTFDFEPNLLQKMLQGLEVTRLRYCDVCKSVFWAFDLRMTYCSSKCRNNKNFREWLSKPDNKELFLRNKKAEYHSRKGSNRFPSRVKKDNKE